MHWLPLFVAATCAAMVARAAPASRAIVSEAGAQYVVGALGPLVAGALRGLSVPGVSGEEYSFDYSISSIAVSSVTYSAATVTFDHAIELRVTGIQVALTCDWSVQEHIWPHQPNGDGTADVQISNSEVAVSLTASALEGKPQVTVDSTKVALGSVSVDAHNSVWSWLVDVLTKEFSGSIKDALASALQSEIGSQIASYGNKMLGSFPTSITIAGNASSPKGAFGLNFSLTSDPQVQPGSLEIESAAVFFNTSMPAGAPQPSADLPSTADDGSMVTAFVDEAMFNSGLALLHDGGFFHASISQSSLPSGFPVQLNTSSPLLKSLIPPLAAAFPDMPVVIGVDSMAAPTVAIAPTGAVLSAALLTAWRVGAGEVEKDAFFLSVNMTFNVDVAVNRSKLTGSVAFTGCTLALLDSNIGSFLTMLLQRLLSGDAHRGAARHQLVPGPGAAAAHA